MNYVRLLATLQFSLLTGLLGYAQPTSPLAGSYFTKFQGFIQKRNIDSTFYYAEKLAADNSVMSNQPTMLDYLLHDSLAHQVKSGDPASVDTAFAGQLVRKLSTGSLPLQQSVYPLFRGGEATQNLADSAKMRQIVAGLMVAQDRSTEERGNRVDRYALLIYELLKSKPAYIVLADTLFNHTRKRLEHAVNSIYYFSVDDGAHRNSRAYFRYLVAIPVSLMSTKPFYIGTSVARATSSEPTNSGHSSTRNSKRG